MLFIKYLIEQAQSPSGEKFIVLVDENMRIVEEVLIFLDYMDKRGMSKNTIDSYCRVLKVYWEWLDFSDFRFYEIKQRNLIDFVEFLNQRTEKKLKPRTVNKYFAAISSFYNYYHNVNGVIIENPIVNEKNQGSNTDSYYVSVTPAFNNNKRNIFKQKVTKNKTNKRLNTNQIEALYNYIPNLYRDQSIAIRNRLIFKLIYETGMRISECMGLRIEDYESPDPTKEIGIIYLRQHDDYYHKDHSFKTLERNIPVSIELIYELEDYILTYRPSNSMFKSIFVNHKGVNKGSYLKRASMVKFFRELSEETSIKCTAHMLRHTHGTELAESGYEQEYIQDRLGHSNIESTNQYMHISLEAQMDAYESFLSMRGRQ